MKRPLIFFLIVLSMPWLRIYPQEVNIETLKEVAKQFIDCQVHSDLIGADQYTISNDIYTNYDAEVPVYSLVSLKPAGFIIISRDRRAVPVLGYSFMYDLDHENMSPALKSWLDGYSQQIIDLKDREEDYQQRNKQWDYYLAAEYLNPGNGDCQDGVEPLLRSLWNQGYYYNFSCPEDPEGPGGHCYTGCVALALAQILFYYRYPEQGTGSVQYVYSYGDTVSVDFSNASYDYEEMVNYIYGQPNPELAELIFHAGASVETTYGPFGSGAYTIYCDDALVDHFKYDSTQILEMFRSDHEEDWKDSLIKNLDYRQPVLYSGGVWTEKHSFVCDGYQDTAFFHFNFGWNNGNGNGYYHIDDITPFHYNLNGMQYGIFNIWPAEDYPPFFTSFDTLTAPRGTLEDGSGPLNYLSNTLEYRIIVADSDEYIMLYFDEFDLGEGDTVWVYDGDNTNSNLLDKYTAGNSPSTISSTSNSMLVLFSSDHYVEAQGWYANYISIDKPFCPDWKEYTDTSHYIWDGSSLVYDYTNNSDCYWYIHPQGYYMDSVAGIDLSILEFDLEEDNDYVTVIEGSTINHPVLEVLTGSNVHANIISNSNELLLNFRSNENITSEGFLIEYCAIPPVYCHDTMIITDAYGNISDGSGDKRYVNNSDCYWMIAPDYEDDTIYLEFTEFKLEYGYDWIEILDPTANPPRLITHLTGDQLPSGVIKANHGAMLLHFYSDHTISKEGWSAQYSSGPNLSHEPEMMEFIKCWPNPATDEVNIEWRCREASSINISLLDCNGRTLYSNTLKSVPGVNRYMIPCTEQMAGIYLLKIMNDKEIITHRIILR